MDLHTVVTSPPVTLITPATGRGAWPSKGTGGTLSLSGLLPGPFYRAPFAPGVDMPGHAAWIALRLGAPVQLADYAVHLAIKAIQLKCGMIGDGLFGPNTRDAVADYQAKAGLVKDGIVGPATTKAMFKPMIDLAAGKISDAHPRLAFLLGGLFCYVSGFEPAAVGVTTTVELVLLVIFGPAHPTLTVEQRLDPAVAITFGAKLVESNLDSLRVETDAIAAFNLGQAGARNWVMALRPQYWGSTDVPLYISRVLAAAETV
jgi:hypothetical protein